MGDRLNAITLKVGALYGYFLTTGISWWSIIFKISSLGFIINL